MGTALLVMAALAAQPLDHRYDGEIDLAVAAVSDIFPVPSELVRAVIRQESGFNERALSRSGARGLMQVMPFNARLLAMSEGDLWNPEKNILAGTRLLAILLKYYAGDLISALTAYNSGPKRLFAPIPNNGETPLYVSRVVAFYRWYIAHPLASRSSTERHP